LEGPSGHRYSWSYHGNEAEIEYLVTLNQRSEPNRTLLALNTYCRPFQAPESRLGVWCPEPGYLRVMCFDPDQLETFPLRDIAGWFKRSQDRIYSTTAPLAEFEISSRLAEGTHPLEVPAEFQAIEELVLIGSYPAPSKEDAAVTVVVVRPREGQVQVLPQKWFTAGKYEVGRQWITRVARDPVSGCLLGEGLRIGNFELTEDGTQIERWLE